MKEIINGVAYEMTESHSEKEIYEGCLSLMEGLMDEFYGYLEFLGVDLKEYPEDERFKLDINPTDIMYSLFLRRTSHSGGTSCRMKCKELGVDPYKAVKYDYSDYTEEE